MQKETINGCDLYCGDALEILPTLKGSAHCLISDPPYKVTSGGFGALEGGFGGWIKDAYDNNGNIVQCDIEWHQWLNLIPDCLAENAHAYIFSNGRNLNIARDAAENAGLDFHTLLVWDKRTAMPNKYYQNICEYILFMKKGKAFTINDPSSKNLQSIYQRDESKHPTEKPVELCALYMNNSTKEGDTVLDCFMGSGTTAVAAVNNKRKFIGIEITQQWFDVACARVEKAGKQLTMF